MARHGGCWLCGAMDEEILTSRFVGLANMEAPAVALCSKCNALDDRELRIRARRLTEDKQAALASLRAAQKEDRNG